jgi:hypothetical protein
MNIYSTTLFLHIVGALGFFSAFALEWTSLRQVQQAMLSDQAGDWMRILTGTRRLGMTSMLISLITGIYMTVTAWRAVPWTIVALASVVLLIALVLTLTRPRVAALGQALAAERGTLSQNFYNLAHHPLLEISLKTRVTIALGIVFLMTAKPGLGGSLLTMVVAAAIGLASAMYMPRHERAQKELPN